MIGRSLVQFSKVQFCAILDNQDSILCLLLSYDSGDSFQLLIIIIIIIVTVLHHSYTPTVSSPPSPINTKPMMMLLCLRRVRLLTIRVSSMNESVDRLFGIVPCCVII